MTDGSTADAVVAVVPRGERFLIVRRAAGVPAPGYWVPPSGHVEPGESQADAVRREMHEELGIDVVPVRRVWTCLTEDGAILLHWWLVAPRSYELRPDPSEVAEARWCTTEEIGALQPTFVDDVRFFVEVWPRVRDARG